MLLTPAAAYAFHFLKFPFRRVAADHHHQRVRAAAAGGDHSAVPAVAEPRADRQLPRGADPLCGPELCLVDLPGEELPRGLPEGADRGGARSTAAVRCRPSGTSCCPTSSTPIFAVGILQFLWTWNALLLPLLYLRTDVPLPVLFARSRGHLRPQLGPPLRRRDHHHHRPARSSSSSSSGSLPPAHRPGPAPRNSQHDDADAEQQAAALPADPPRLPHLGSTSRGVGAAFDPETFVATLKAAHVNSITMFAKCHHGWSYYPTKVGAPHPNLARPDLLGDMVGGAERRRYRMPDLHLGAVGRAQRAPASRVARDERHQPLPARADRRPIDGTPAQPGLAYALPQPRGLPRRAAGAGARGAHATTRRRGSSSTSS